ncbi:ABC transporter ATP-binding protein [Komagataeibacter sp. NFXK3]
MSDIVFQSVCKIFPAVPARKGERDYTVLHDVSLNIRAGEFMCLVGPSGCGKSTLLDLMAGLDFPTDGTILIDGEPIKGPAASRSVVFQQYALMPWLSALQNVEFALEAAGVPRNRRRERALAYLRLVGLSDFAHRRPNQLSGGMKQRVAIARSLSVEPRVLLMDEPFGALDAQTREGLQDELLRLWHQSRQTIVFITHDIDEALYLGQRVAIMTRNPGQIAEIIDVPFSARRMETNVRRLPEFSALRHQIWRKLKPDALPPGTYH